MEVIKSDTSNNGKKASLYKEYERIVYWCKQDDIWMNLETPKKDNL